MKKVSERIFYVFKIIFIFLGNLIALFWPSSKSTSSYSNPPKNSSKKESLKKV